MVHGSFVSVGINFFCPRANLPGFFLLVIGFGGSHVVFAAKAYQMSRIREKNTVVVGPARDIFTAMVPTSK
jgi:hypothetical protein